MLDDLVGKVLEGKYRVLRKLQETETTAVFAGYHTGIDRPLTIKVFRPEYVWPAGDQHTLLTLQDRYIWSSDQAASLTFQGQELGYVVMRRPDGCSLQEELSAGRLSAERLDHILGQVGHALHAAHEQGFVHEGVDSSKIWIDGQGNARLLDFDFVPLVKPKPRTRWPLYAALILVVGAAALWLVFTRASLPFWGPGQPTAQPAESAGLAPAPTATRPPTPTHTVEATQTASTGFLAAPVSTPTRTATPMLTPTPVGTPLAWSSRAKLTIFTAPGGLGEMWAEVDPGVPVVLRGCTRDGLWWQVEHISQEGWVPAHSAVSNLNDPCAQVSVVVPTSTPTATPSPTATEMPSPTPLLVPVLANPTFEGITPNHVPGWMRWASDTCPEDTKCDPYGFDTPLYKEADDPVREISGPTLQIDATGFVQFRAGVFQVVQVSPGTSLRATVQARAYSDHGTIRVHIGIDPNGQPTCEHAHYGPHRDLNQEVSVVDLTTPELVAGPAGRITVCLFAETSHPAHSNAAFFDNVTLALRSR